MTDEEINDAGQASTTTKRAKPAKEARVKSFEVHWEVGSSGEPNVTQHSGEESACKKAIEMSKAHGDAVVYEGINDNLNIKFRYKAGKRVAHEQEAAEGMSIGVPMAVEAEATGEKIMKGQTKTKIKTAASKAPAKGKGKPAAKAAPAKGKPAAAKGKPAAAKAAGKKAATANARTPVAKTEFSGMRGLLQCRAGTLREQAVALLEGNKGKPMDIETICKKLYKSFETKDKGNFRMVWNGIVNSITSGKLPIEAISNKTENGMQYGLRAKK